MGGGIRRVCSCITPAVAAWIATGVGQPHSTCGHRWLAGVHHTISNGCVLVQGDDTMWMLVVGLYHTDAVICGTVTGMV